MDPESQTNDAKILSLLPAEKIVPVSDWTVGFVDLLCAASLLLLVCAPSCLEASQKLLCHWLSRADLRTRRSASTFHGSTMARIRSKELSCLKSLMKTIPIFCHFHHVRLSSDLWFLASSETLD